MRRLDAVIAARATDALVHAAPRAAREVRPLDFAEVAIFLPASLHAVTLTIELDSSIRWNMTVDVFFYSRMHVRSMRKMPAHAMSL